jgi:hypothetical protein
MGWLTAEELELELGITAQLRDGRTRTAGPGEGYGVVYRLASTGLNAVPTQVPVGLNLQVTTVHNF